MKWLLAALVVFAVAGEAVAAHRVCLPVEIIREKLRTTYEEVWVWSGFVTPNLLTELWMGTDTFTILSVDSQGVACVQVVGSSWWVEVGPKKGKPL